MACDVLNLEWSSAGRDREVASLICATLRRRGHTVVEDSVFDYRRSLHRHRPRLLYLADPRGAAVNYAAALYAREHGFPIATVMAEGNIKGELAPEMFWGHVAGGELVERLHLLWSERARNLVLGVEPGVADLVKVAGGVGFDRYLLYDFMSREGFLRDRGLEPFERVVGYASWTFDRVARQDAQARDIRAGWGEQLANRFERDREELRTLISGLAEAHPQTLFLLKEHPGVVEPAESEIAGLEGHANVVVIRDELPIADCIAVSDLWTAFDSTTCLEAWLLGKPTLLLNPSGPDFPRDDSHTGSPVASTREETSAAIDAGVPAGFPEREPQRQAVIEATIGWADGRNHLRAAHYIEELLAKLPEPPPAAPLGRLRGWAASLRAYRPSNVRFDRSELEQVSRRATAAVERFDPEHELTEADLAELGRINDSATLSD